MGLSNEAAARTLRIGIGRFTSAAEIDAAVAELVGAYQSLLQTTTEV
jgi:cysteine desulfurase